MHLALVVMRQCIKKNKTIFNKFIKHEKENSKQQNGIF